MRVLVLGVAAAACLLSAQANAQAPAAPVTPVTGRTPLRGPPTIPYGMPITLEQAMKAAGVINGEIAKRNLKTVTFAIVEPSGELVYYQKATDANYAAYDMSIKKARSAARLTRSTSFDRDRMLNGEDFIMAFADVFPTGGGVPIVLNGRVIGAIGVTGGGDEVLAKLAADAVK